MQKLLAFLYGYALLIGLTSHRLVNGRFRPTRITKTYACLVNLGLLAALPYCLWVVASEQSSLYVVPRFIRIAPYVMNLLNFAVILYTLAYRCHRDNITLDLQRLVLELNREMTRTGKKTSSKLRKLLYIKIFTMVYQSLSNVAGCFLYGSPLVFHCMPRIILAVHYIGLNLIIGNVFLYFLSFWNLARGYDFVNGRIDELFSDLGPLSASKKQEISSLWALHFRLGRTAERINALCGPQMLASRFIYLVFSGISGYISFILWKDHNTPWYFVCLWGILSVFRSLGAFLNDYVFGLTNKYQNMRRDWITEEEGPMSKELSAYIIYESSMKRDLKFCGLFTGNRMTWLQLMELILSYFILLLQFHLVFVKK